MYLTVFLILYLIFSESDRKKDVERIPCEETDWY